MSKPEKLKQIRGDAAHRTTADTIRSPQFDLPQGPSWQFHLLRKDSKFAWPADSKDKRKILEIFRHFEKMQWDEIVGPRNHSLNSDTLNKTAKNELKKLNQEDLEIATVFSLHINGRERIFGIRDKNILKLL